MISASSRQQNQRHAAVRLSLLSTTAVGSPPSLTTTTAGTEKNNKKKKTTIASAFLLQNSSSTPPTITKVTTKTPAVATATTDSNKKSTGRAVQKKTMLHPFSLLPEKKYYNKSNINVSGSGNDGWKAKGQGELDSISLFGSSEDEQSDGRPKKNTFKKSSVSLSSESSSSSSSLLTTNERDAEVAVVVANNTNRTRGGDGRSRSNNNPQRSRCISRRRHQQLKDQLVRERELMANYHDDWESLQDHVNILTKQNLFLTQKMNNLQDQMAVLQDEYEVSKFTWQDRFKCPTIQFLPPVQYELLEEEKEGRIGDYNLLECIGQGSFARVYKAVTTNNNDGEGERKQVTVAVKRCSKSSFDCMAQVRQLDKEVQILQMSHKHKIDFLEILHARDSIYLVMEYAWTNVHSVFTSRQHELCLHRPEKRLEATRQVLRGLLSALEFMHHHRVAHLDVKPENIVMVPPLPRRSPEEQTVATTTGTTTDGGSCHQEEDYEVMASNVRLCDFGFSRFCRDDGAVVVNCGGCSGDDKKNKKNPRAREVEDCHYHHTADNTSSSSVAFIIGTPGFYAPEMVLPRMGRCRKMMKNLDRHQFCFNGLSADMWSVGATLLDLTVGFCDEWMNFYAAAKTDRSRFEEGLFWCLQDINSQQFLKEDPAMFDLLTKGLLVQSNRRSTAQQALTHPWITQQE